MPFFYFEGMFCMRKTVSNREEGSKSNLLTVSAKVLPVWKVLISWVGMGMVFYLSSQVLRGVSANFFLCFGMVAVLTFQYGTDFVTKLFGRMRKGTKRWIPFYLFAGFAASYVLDMIFRAQLVAHVSIESTNQLSLPAFILEMLVMVVGIIGEEASVAILAFPIFGWLNQQSELRNYAYFLSAMISSVIFGISHLPVYQWNWIQCIFIIGLPRIFYNYAWKKTDSLWGGVWVHVLNNWIGFILIYLNQFLPSH